MTSNSWEGLLTDAQVDGPALVNTTTPTSILPPAARFNFPSNIDQIGTKFRLKAFGKLSSKSASPGTLTFDFRIGSVIVLSLGVSPALTASLSNVPWTLSMDMTVRAIGGGTSANIMGIGKFDVLAAAGSYVGPSPPAVGTGFDSTASAFMDLFATWSLADPANSITLNDYCIELLN